MSVKEHLCLVCKTPIAIGRKFCSYSCNNIAKNTTHGLSKTPEYRIWFHMILRCHDNTRHDWPKYGGKGITVCDRWRQSINNFLEDMGLRPTPKHTIDRYPDRTGNYEPSNCRWATMAEQNQHRIDNVVNWESVREIRYRVDRGESIAAVARDLNIGYMAVYKVARRITWKES